ncbi:MAG TPA: hypothetical protein VNF75_06960 [Candidatus Dormibacteraeota bacterium]|nr:hypothetical protein [Candidatus Dormibacteraeota bacterium]
MGKVSRTRWGSAVGPIVVLVLLASTVLAAAPGAAASSLPTLRWTVTKTSGPRSTYTVSGSSYSLTLPWGSPLLAIHPAVGEKAFNFPLAALIGRSADPSGVRLSTSTSGATLVLTVSTRARVPLLQATVTAEAAFFTVRFAGQLGPSPSLEPAFFSTGRTGMAMTTVTGGFTPDPRSPPLTRTPKVELGPIPIAPYTAPFSPPPFDVELATPAGWLGGWSSDLQLRGHLPGAAAWDHAEKGPGNRMAAGRRQRLSSRFTHRR